MYLTILGGKSAILTAMTVCLGARASSTQRATSLESLIKEGAAEARVIVKLSNGGTLRFKSDLYGNSIIIERRFRRNGPNSFKVKSGETGRIVSERRDEVISICDNYNIQVDNPLSVLTQETAKKFLVNSTPQDLYAFFSRGTQLEQLSFDYAYCLDRMQTMANSIDAAKKVWPSLEATIEKLQDDLEIISEKKETAQKILELKAEITWAEIGDLEKEAHEKEEALSAEQEIVEANNEEVVTLNQKLLETNETLKAIDSEITELYSSKRPLTEEITRIERNLAATQNEYSSNESVLRDINSSVAKVKQELEAAQSKLEESLRDTDADKIDKRNQVDRLEKEVQESSRLLQEINEQLRLKKSNYDSLEANLENAKSELEKEKRLGESLEKKLDVEKSAAVDKLKFYGEKIPEVLKIIKERKNDFRYQPIGPIGMHVELKHNEWAQTMDAIIGTQLRSFITHDHQDRILLESILKEFRCQNPVINMSRDHIDISSGEPDPKFLTALRALKIDNEMVKKALVIFASIERVLLISDNVEARQVMMERLRNVDAAYTRTHRIASTQNAVAFFAIFPSNKGNPFESSEERIKTISAQIKQNVHRINIITRDIQGLEESIKDTQKDEEQLKEQKDDVMEKIHLLKSDIRTIEEALKSTDETGTEVWKSERDLLLSELESLKSQFGDNFESQMQLKEEIENLNASINSIKEQLGIKDAEIKDKNDFLNLLGNERRKYQAEIENFKTSNQQLNKLIATRTAALNSIRQKIAETISKVPVGFERINTTRSIKWIEKEIIRLDTRIKLGQEYNPEDFDRVKAELEEKTADYETSKSEVRINQITVDDMKIALGKRQRQWERLRDAIAVRSNNDFGTCLQARDYRGFLEYDHSERVLNINVHIDQMEQQSTSKRHKKDGGENFKLSKRDIKQLSGGEKSFGTTCFLLSLWDAMGCPIRCLDEFDVYMDPVNRRLVVEMLVNNARRNSTQFILITPVSVRNFLGSEDKDNVHMVVLSDPKRT